MRETPVLPGPLRWMQPILVRAAVEIIPDWVRQCLGLTEFYGLFSLDESAVRLLGSSFEQHRSGRKPRGAIVPSARDIGLPTL